MELSVVVFLSALFGIAASSCCDEYGYNCDCYYSVYTTWWFWVAVVVGVLLKFLCIGCYVSNRRKRMRMYYVPTPTVQTQTCVTTNTTVRVPVANARPNNMPPPYPGYAPQPCPGYAPQPYPQAAGPSQANVVQSLMDTRIEKDTQLLVA